MQNILSDPSKFTEVSAAEDKQLNFIVNAEKHINHREGLKNSEVISETFFKSLRPRGSRFGILHSLCKVHKQLLDNCPPFGPIMSAIKTPTYNLAKILVPLQDLITTKIHTIKKVLNLPKKLLTIIQDFSWPV